MTVIFGRPLEKGFFISGGGKRAKALFPYIWRFFEEGDDMSKKGCLMQIQPFSVNDGDGIRSTVFLAGCPLHCKWCANPEGLQQRPIVGFYARNCIGCGACVKVCPRHIGIDLNAEREKCTGCGACVKACPKNARKQLVSYADREEILKEVKKHTLFYQQSGGGITFSGGEATAQAELLDDLTTELYDMGYSLDMETCGYFDFDSVLPILRRMDLIFMDLKHMDGAEHEKFTGVSNERILENMKRLGETGARIVIRIPVIEGVNADEENIRKSGEFVKKYLPQAEMELLPYHKFGFGKYEALGLPLPDETFETPTPEKIERLKGILQELGIPLADFR